MWIISDLHISDRFSLINRAEIERILDFLKNMDADEIVFNGDIFDFARVYNIPEGKIVSRRERRYGLASSEQNALLKMRMIIDSNKYFFDAIGILLKKGFKITFLLGNHDSELRYNSVQRLIEEAAGDSQKRLHFDKIYFKDGIYIEHGHQFDPENRLVYVDGALPSEEYSFGYVTSKYFGNIIEREKGLPRNDISAGEYFIWVFRNFGLRAFFFIFRYFIYAFIVLSRSGKNFFLSNGEYEDDLYATPIMTSIRLTLKRLYLIQVSISILLLFILLLTLIIKPNHLYIPVLGFILCIIPLFSINNRKKIDKILSDASQKLKINYNADKIVFGHNHYADMREWREYLSSKPILDDGNIYILRVSCEGSLYQKI